ncbi:TPA: DUF1016 N-terminal domain-containing protein [Legionella pneumophila]|uniref:DUF1016 N-terminal domain-containing protein n=1 Tax=Legionella pneumophila TaxID=446 RepID=UPI0009B0F1F3|nr:DUF1016 N-terminal domain-containing protein [Legionella pneumophila]
MRWFTQPYLRIEFAKQSVLQLPWGHIVRLMQMLKEESKREWYAEQTIKNGCHEPFLKCR